MNQELLKAKEQLLAGNFTCVFIKGDALFTSTERGVKPLLDLLDKYGEMRSYYAADKVVGRAAAFLYVLLKVRAVYVQVISRSALEVLREYDVEVYYDTEVPAIRNRTNTGFCPMEQATRESATPEDALAKIRETLVRLHT